MTERNADRSASVVVIGGGLAGCEAAWQVARTGLRVALYEMRPVTTTPAHQTGLLAELVCSNSLGSNLVDRAPGLLKEELRRLGSLIIACADKAALPAGGALAVGRGRFSELVTERIEQHPQIHLVRQEVETLSGESPTVIATGPLTSETLSNAIQELAGEDQLYFYDAMAPIVTAESVDMTKAYRGSRYGRGEDDYINCPMTEQEYRVFLDALLEADRITLRGFEREDPKFFEGCLPIEILGSRGVRSLAYGPLKPVGLDDPRTGKMPFAVVQLRQDNLAGSLYNLVGFQTNLKWGEQARVFRLIPGLENADFARYGQMHRNTYINSPQILDATLQCRLRENLFFAGQITGTEGYVASTASGLVAGKNVARWCQKEAQLVWPGTTMVGALCNYVSHAGAKDFQPMKPNFGLLPPMDPPVRNKRKRYAAYADRALADLCAFVETHEGYD